MAAGLKETTMESITQVKNEPSIDSSPEVTTSELWTILRSQFKTLDRRARHGAVVGLADLQRLSALLDDFLTSEAGGLR